MEVYFEVAQGAVTAVTRRRLDWTVLCVKWRQYIRAVNGTSRIEITQLTVSFLLLKVPTSH